MIGDMPTYRDLWLRIREDLPKKGRGTGRGHGGAAGRRGDGADGGFRPDGDRQPAQDYSEELFQGTKYAFRTRRRECG
jgi:hypothetical protein